jgi:hypothetical protein
MKRNHKQVRSWIFGCLLMLSATTGCTTMYYRSTYIKSHSIDTFMADRPPAADVLRQHPDLEHWLRIEWSRPIAGSHLVWDNRKPIVSPESEYAPAPPPWRVIGIRVSKDVSPVDQLLDLSFETCNAHGSPRIAALEKQAAANTITRQDFVDGIEATEYDAVLHMKDSFPKLFILSTNEMTAHYRTFLAVPIGFQAYRTWLLNRHDTNYMAGHESYERVYDELAKGKTAAPIISSH